MWNEKVASREIGTLKTFFVSFIYEAVIKVLLYLY